MSELVVNKTRGVKEHRSADIITFKGQRFRAVHCNHKFLTFNHYRGNFSYWGQQNLIDKY